MVKVEKDGTVMRGTGFSASGISKTFSFRGTVSGDIETKNSEEEAAGEGGKESEISSAQE